MFYYRCKYVLDFYIVLFLSMLSQAVVFNKIFNLLYKQFFFIHIDFTAGTKIIQQSPVPNMSRLLLLFGCDGRQVDVTLHGGQRFNLASCPASLPLPQAAWRANAKPAIATRFANTLFVVIDVGHTSHCYHAGVQYLGASKMTTLSTEQNTVLTQLV